MELSRDDGSPNAVASIPFLGIWLSMTDDTDALLILVKTSSMALLSVPHRLTLDPSLPNGTGIPVLVLVFMSG